LVYFIGKVLVFYPLFLSARCYHRTPVENLLTFAFMVRKVNGEQERRRCLVEQKPWMCGAGRELECTLEGAPHSPPSPVIWS